MKIFNKVAIIGIGLIGGSLGLAIKKRRLANLVIGISRHKKTLLLARQKKAVDIASRDLNLVKDADLIIFATPVNTVMKVAKKIHKIVHPHTIVTDVGSTKKEIVCKLNNFFPRFIGSHPLAGSEKRGVANAGEDIFNNSLCLVTPNNASDRLSLQKIERFWRALGTRVMLTDPSRHDEILAFVSHLPHLVIFSLVQAVPKRYLWFSASGFKDTTRVASSDAILWSDIFLSNQKPILKALREFKYCLSEIETKLRKKNTRGLIKFLKKAKKIRDSLR